ncbi:hypothetical protein ACQJBY_012116 [Aegilops geniculata]
MAGAGQARKEHSATEEEVDSKAAVARLITLKVVSQERVVRHTMKMTDKLQVLMDVWYHKVPEVTPDTGLFMINGSRFRPESTPEELELEEDDMVDFFEHVDGGAPLVAAWMWE